MIRTAARILGAIVTLAWLVPLVGGLFGGEAGVESDSARPEGAVLTALVLGAILCTVMSSFRGGPWSLGVLAAGASLCVFAVLTAGRNQWIAVLVAGVPWLAVGSLFLVADRREGAKAPD